MQATTTVTAAHHPVLVWLSEQPGAHVPLDLLEYRNGGMYTKKFIPKGEVLLVVPPSAMFIHDNVPLDWEDEYVPEDDDDDYKGDVTSLECLSAWLLAQEYQKILVHQEKDVEEANPSITSRFALFVRFVMEEFHHEYLPLNWSRRAVSIFKNLIVGTHLEPQAFGLDDVPVGLYLQDCNSFYSKYQHHHKQKNSNVDEATFLRRLDAAVRVVYSRGWYHVLVPVFDMFNHRNSGVRTPNGVQHSDWHNVGRMPVATTDSNGRKQFRRPSILEEYRIVALRDIEAGEELYNSYNQCHDLACPTSMAETFITPHLFAEYGFVEQYPQRWRFYSKESGYLVHDIVFELDEKKNPDPSHNFPYNSSVHDDPQLPSSKPELALTWLSTSIIPVDSERRNVLYNHWKRLVNLKTILEQETQAMLIAATTNGTATVQTEREVSLIWDYYHALITALEQVMIATANATAPVAAAEAKRATAEVELENEANERQLMGQWAKSVEDGDQSWQAEL